MLELFIQPVSYLSWGRLSPDALRAVLHEGPRAASRRAHAPLSFQVDEADMGAIKVRRAVCSDEKAPIPGQHCCAISKVSAA